MWFLSIAFGRSSFGNSETLRIYNAPSRQAVDVHNEWPLVYFTDSSDPRWRTGQVCAVRQVRCCSKILAAHGLLRPNCFFYNFYKYIDRKWEMATDPPSPLPCIRA